MDCCCDRGKARVVALLDVDSFEVQARGMSDGYTPDELQSRPFAACYHFVVSANKEAKQRGVERGPTKNQKWIPKDQQDVNILWIPRRYGKPENLSRRIAGDDIYDCIIKAFHQWANHNNFTKGRCRTCRRQYSRMVIEKSNCDEFYLDLTNEVDFLMSKSCPPYYPYFTRKSAPHYARKFVLDLPSSGYVFPKEYNFRSYTKSVATSDQQLCALLHGADIIEEVLNTVKDQLGFVISAGLGGNKLFAKLACHRSKPNGIAVLPTGSFKRVQNEMEFTKIPGLGGDTGKMIMNDWKNISTISEFRRAFYQLDLWRYISANSDDIYDKCDGIDESPVVPKDFLDKITCGTTLNTTSWNQANTKENFLYHLYNRFLEMRENLVYEYNRHDERIPRFLRLEIHEHSSGGNKPRIVFRGDVGFHMFNMNSLLSCNRSDTEDWNDVNEEEGLIEWKPILGNFKELINKNSAFSLFHRDGRYIPFLRRISLIAYF